MVLDASSYLILTSPLDEGRLLLFISIFHVRPQAQRSQHDAQGHTANEGIEVGFEPILP